MEIAGVALAIPPLLVGIRKCVKVFAELRDGYKDADEKISVLITQCELLETALDQAQDIAKHVPTTHLASVTADCSKAVKGLEGLLTQFGIDVDNPGPMETMAKIGFMMKEEDLKPVLERLDRCHRNLETYLGIIRFEYMQLSLSGKYSSTTKANRRSSSIIQADDETLRFSFLSNNSKFSTTALYIKQDRMSALSVEFDFDKAIQSSKAYRRLGNSNGSITDARFTDHAASNGSSVLFQPRRPSDASTATAQSSQTILSPSAVSAIPEDKIADFDASSSEAEPEDAFTDDDLAGLSKVERKLAEVGLFSTKSRERKAGTNPSTQIHNLTPQVSNAVPHGTTIPLYFNIVVMGLDVSNPIVQFLHDKNGPGDYPYSKNCNIDNEPAVLNTQFVFNMPTKPSIIDQCDGFLLTYSIFALPSFIMMNWFYEKIIAARKATSIPILVVEIGTEGGSRGKRNVNVSDGEMWANSRGLRFIQAPLSTSQDVEQLLFDLVRDIRLQKGNRALWLDLRNRRLRLLSSPS